MDWVLGWRLGVRLGKIMDGHSYRRNWIFCLSKRDAYLEQALKVIFYPLLVLWRLLIQKIRIYRLSIHSDLKATIDTDRILDTYKFISQQTGNYHLHTLSMQGSLTVVYSETPLHRKLVLACLPSNARISSS